MIHTIGYSKLTPAKLVDLVAKLGIDTVIDARSVPVTRCAGFGRRQLETLLGSKYEWRGPDLGGRDPGVTTEGLASIRAADKKGKRQLVMCTEHIPADCHRHWAIGLPLASGRKPLEVFHLFGDEVIEVKELHRAMLEDDDYSFTALGAHIAMMSSAD
jgi:uncharacterized protein (DUF488 family)